MDPRIKTEPHTNGTDAMLQYMSGFCARYTRKWYTGFHNSLHPLQALFYAGIHIILGQCMAVYTVCTLSTHIALLPDIRYESTQGGGYEFIMHCNAIRYATQRAAYQPSQTIPYQTSIDHTNR